MKRVFMSMTNISLHISAKRSECESESENDTSAQAGTQKQQYMSTMCVTLSCVLYVCMYAARVRRDVTCMYDAVRACIRTTCITHLRKGDGGSSGNPKCSGRSSDGTSTTCSGSSSSSSRQFGRAWATIRSR